MSLSIIKFSEEFRVSLQSGSKRFSLPCTNSTQPGAKCFGPVREGEKSHAPDTDEALSLTLVLSTFPPAGQKRLLVGRRRDESRKKRTILRNK